jgi:NhaP-type Na+/H+ or K+/H+ antiporter
MLVLILIRLLRDISGLIAVIGALFTGVLVRSEFLHADWRERWGNKDQVVILGFAIVTLTTAVIWFLAQRKERATVDQRNLKSRQCGYLISN